MSGESCNVLLIYPRFNGPSFWNYTIICEMMGARYPAAPLGLITVAAMLPPSWQARLVDRNTEVLTPADLDQADLVMTGGMLPQQSDVLELIEMCRAKGKPIVVGGPDISSSPHIYDRADFKVLGEAELVIDAFIAAWISGARSGVFEAEKFTADVTKSPVPRFDLLKFKHYLHVGVQFSRGCPFNCEFCDIIELYGRVPRAKTTPQMLAELDALFDLGYRGHVDFVDDNLVGNKKALKLFLPKLTEWQKARGYPFEFSTEASINLSDDDQLLALMRDANFFALFVGIESPDTDTLIAAQKKQNTRRSLAASVHKIYRAGMFVTAGFILGFDTEKGSVAESMIDCIETTAIPVSMAGLLYALPNTQLTRRLHREGRLHEGHDDMIESAAGDQCAAGLNFETIRPRRDILVDYTTVLEKIYDPITYFERVQRMGRLLAPPAHGMRFSLRTTFGDLYRLGRLILLMAIRMPDLLGHFWTTFYDCAKNNPRVLKSVVSTMALYIHFGPFSREIIAGLRAQIAAIDAGEWTQPALIIPPKIPPKAAPTPPVIGQRTSAVSSALHG